MNEPLLPREIREQIREQLRKTPFGADHNGRTDLDRQATAAMVAGFTVPEPVADDEPHTMRPNRAQGHGSAPVPAPTPTNVLDAIRVQAAKLTNL